MIDALDDSWSPEFIIAVNASWLHREMKIGRVVILSAASLTGETGTSTAYERNLVVTDYLTRSNALQLVVTLRPEDFDADHADRSALALLSDLRDSAGAIEVAHLSRATDLSGAKSAETITAGVLALSVIPALLPRLVEVLQAWSLRWKDYRIRIKRQHGDQSFELEYSPGKTSPEDLQRLLDLLASAFPYQAPASEPTAVDEKKDLPSLASQR